MSRPVCPELYPNPRPSRIFEPILPYLPQLLRLLPWLAAAPAAFALAALILTALPVITWIVLCIAVLTPLAGGVAMFTLGWE